MEKYKPPLDMYLDLSDIVDRDYPDYVVKVAIGSSSLELGPVTMGRAC